MWRCVGICVDYRVGKLWSTSHIRPGVHSNQPATVFLTCTANNLWTDVCNVYQYFAYLCIVTPLTPTRLSCIVCGVNWIGDKSRLSATEWFQISFVQTRNAVWTESCLVLTQFPIRNVVTYCDVIFGKWVKTSSQMRSHCRQHWTKLFSFQYWGLLKTVCDYRQLWSHCRQDKTRQSCELGMTVSEAWKYVTTEELSHKLNS